MISRRVVGRLIGAMVGGLALLSGSVAIPAVPAAAAGPRAGAVAPAAVSGTGLELTLTKVSPAAAGPDDEVVVSGSVRNLGGTAIKNVRISLWLRPQVLPDRAAIDTWLAEGSLTTADRQLSDDARVRSLASGQTVPFRIVVPPGQTGLYSASGFGPRAIALQARADGRRLASLRSTIVWAPSEITTPTRLSVIVPITASTPTTHAGEPTAKIADDLLPEGRLHRVLTAAHNSAMAWAVDPAILTAAQRLSTDGVDRTPDDADLADSTSNDPNSTGSTVASVGSASAATDAETTAELTDEHAELAAENWLTLFRAESRDRGLFGLPYADPDLTSVLRTAKGIPLLRSSDALGKAATAEVLGSPLDTTLAWPADGQINAATTRNLIRLKRTTVILADSAQPPAPELDYTPTGRSTVRSSVGSLTGLLYDRQLSTLISGAASQTPAATQTLLAQLAAITMEQPGTGRHLLAVTPRTWNPDPTAARTMMDALGSAPWISLRGISELQKATGPLRSAPIYRRATARAELPIGSISAAQRLDDGLSTFAPILVDPAPAVPLRERVASLLSVAWRQDPNELVAARIDVAEDVNTVVGGVRLGTSSYLFTARENKIPVTVLNGTDYQVKVVVRLQPQSGQLTFGNNVTVTVEPKKSLQVQVDAQAVASGNVVVEGQLLSPAGDALGPAVNFTVRVRPDWERWGMIGTGSVLAFLLVIGLMRSVRRNRTRTRVPIEAVPDIDELATRQAAIDATATGSGPTPAAGPPAASSGSSGSTDSPGGSSGSTGSSGSAGGSTEPARAASAAGSVWPARTDSGYTVRTLPLPDAVMEPDIIRQPDAVQQSDVPTPEAVRDASSELAPDPVPVPIAVPEAEPDPKAGGGPVEPDGVRQPVGHGAGRSARPG